MTTAKNRGTIARKKMESIRTQAPTATWLHISRRAIWIKYSALQERGNSGPRFPVNTEHLKIESSNQMFLCRLKDFACPVIANVKILYKLSCCSEMVRLNDSITNPIVSLTYRSFE